jgi:hypothetical protein
MPNFRLPWPAIYAVWGLLAGALAQAGSARADFEASSNAWSGLADLVALARDHDIELRTHRELDLSALRSNDGLLLVHPLHEPPAADLVAFMREGGRLALVDDFGEGEALLDVFHI